MYEEYEDFLLFICLRKITKLFLISGSVSRFPIDVAQLWAIARPFKESLIRYAVKNGVYEVTKDDFATNFDGIVCV